MEADRDNNRRAKRKALWIQVIICLSMNLTNISPGMTLSFTAVALPAFRNQNETFCVDDEEASWIASLGLISTPVGAIISGPVLDFIGRRWSLLFLNVPALLGWILIAFASGEGTLYTIYAGRIVTGITIGMLSTPCAVYISEITRNKIRGMLVTWASIAFSLGMLLMYILGAIFPTDWRSMARISILFPILSAIVNFFMLPESPSWLLLRQRKKEAMECFKRIRGVPNDEELPEIFMEEYKKLEEHAELQSNIKIDFKETIQEFRKPRAWKPLLIMMTFFFFQQASGVYVIMAYAVDVIIEFGVLFNAYYLTILIGLMRLLVTFLLGYASMKLGRRKLIIPTGCGMGFFMFVLTLFRYLQHIEIIQQGEYSWIPCLCILMVIFTGALGFLSLPWAMIGEVFPLTIRGITCGLTIAFANLLEFLVVKFYPSSVKAYGGHSVFFFFTIALVFGTIFVAMFLPETQGKTLAEIEDGFTSKKKKNICKPGTSEVYIINRLHGNSEKDADHSELTVT